MMKKMRFSVTIQAFESEAPTGLLSDLVTVYLIEEKPQVALERAKKLISKKFYRISTITELDDKQK